MEQPQVYMIAGPNGAGKTSAAMMLLPDFLHLEHFVNADNIAYGLSPLAPKIAAIEAGRLMIKRIHYLTEKKQHFAFETTASGHIHLRTLTRCKEAGFKVSVMFLYVASPELAIERVKFRVSQGGHNVAEKDIVRRYYKGLHRIINQYIPLADNVEIYDNSYGEPSLVAERYNNDEWILHQPTIWKKMKEYANE